MTNQIVNVAKERMTNLHQDLACELGLVRAGCANARLLDKISVEYYGINTPLNQLASITIPEARVLLITPFDKSSIKAIERSINVSDLGLTPFSDGSVIRLVIPPLTEETRCALVKKVKKIGESAKITIRNIRRDAITAARKKEKERKITKDDLTFLETQIQEVTDGSVKYVDEMVEAKSKELLSI